jgi:hypothetical protein
MLCLVVVLSPTHRLGGFARNPERPFNRVGKRISTISVGKAVAGHAAKSAC